MGSEIKIDASTGGFRRVRAAIEISVSMILEGAKGTLTVDALPDGLLGGEGPACINRMPEGLRRHLLVEPFSREKLKAVLQFLLGPHKTKVELSPPVNPGRNTFRDDLL